MNAASVKTCGSCEHSTPSTVENMTGFVWCTKRKQVGRSMEAVFHNPDWPRDCSAFSSLSKQGAETLDGFFTSTESITTSIAIAVTVPPVPSIAPSSLFLAAKPTQTADMFADLFI